MPLALPLFLVNNIALFLWKRSVRFIAFFFLDHISWYRWMNVRLMGSLCLSKSISLIRSWLHRITSLYLVKCANPSGYNSYIPSHENLFEPQVLVSDRSNSILLIAVWSVRFNMYDVSLLVKSNYPIADILVGNTCTYIKNIVFVR